MAKENINWNLEINLVGVSMYKLMILVVLFIVFGCNQKQNTNVNKLSPVVITEQVKHDTDDPAIWIHPTDPSKSLIIGTDKEEDGALYVYNLDGKIDEQKTVRGLKRPNNVDIEYGFVLDGVATDIVVTTERLENRLRIFSLPDMKPIDNGGIEVFRNEDLRFPMGIALYKRPSDGSIYAIVGRKEGPTDGTYLWQYQLEDDGTGMVKGTKVREFGKWSGIKEIEAIAVDDALGYVYYSDENVGIRKYHADPDNENADVELALFGTEEFTQDREGISIYQVNDGTGYILISDQEVNKYNIYKREGEPGDPHSHPLVKVIDLSTLDSDGCEVTNVALNEKFPAGLFVAMSDDKTFQFYSWKDIAGDDLMIAPDGQKKSDGLASEKKEIEQN
jgi:myo-inositol-hexaphosphate 3-phosphohydrolase